MHGTSGVWTGVCNNTPGTAGPTLEARGDLDGDTTIATFQLATGTSPDNELYHSTGFYIVNETE